MSFKSLHCFALFAPAAELIVAARGNDSVV